MKVLIYGVLEKLFAKLEEWAGDRTRQFAICPDCERNRYTGRPCVDRGWSE